MAVPDANRKAAAAVDQASRLMRRAEESGGTPDVPAVQGGVLKAVAAVDQASRLMVRD